MRNVENLLGDKIDEAVTHYINSHQPPENVHVDANSMPLNVQDDSGRVVTVMHSQTFPPQMCRQLSVGEGGWAEELLETDSRLAALVAHLAEHSRTTHHTHPHVKVPAVRSNVDTSVILDAPMRLFNGQTLEQQQEPIVVEVPSLAPLPPLQDMKRCSDTDWFNKNKNALKDNTQLLESEGGVLDIAAGASPVQKQNKKSLPHKKRISKKLKRTNGSSTPQQDIVVINCSEEVQQEEILPDNFVGAVQHQDHMPPDPHHMSHEMRAMFICQLCGEFYGEEQLKFYQHLKHHYEPHATIIIENPVPDLGIDKMTNTCIVDNVPTLPDSIVELSLENTVPKTMYQPIDKHILYTSGDKLNYNKVYHAIDKEPETEKSEMYRVDLDKLELYYCTKCNKSFRKQKQCEAHIKEAHSTSKIDDMGEFSEPEDLMEGIHVAVEGAAVTGDTYDNEHSLLPHLTIENGHVHQEHVRQWYLRNGGSPPMPLCSCGSAGYCACAHMQMHSHMHTAQTQTPAQTQTQIIHSTSLPASPPAVPVSLPSLPSQTVPTESVQRTAEQKEETLQRIFEESQENPSFSEPQPEAPVVKVKEEPGTNSEKEKKKAKLFECTQCDRAFSHRNSLLYHILMHSEKQEVCKECGKRFYTVSALKVHKRVHNGDRPCKCDVCGRDFRQWSDLKYHKASIHSNQKQFKCEFCNKEFARRYSLNVHRRIHTGERNYKCEFCNKTFRASSYRLSHMRTHTATKPYKCEQCDKSFRVMYDLRRHMLIHEKVRVRTDEKKRDTKDKKTPQDIKTEVKNEKSKDKKTENARLPILKSLLDKKQAKLPKKSPKKPPNVTIQRDEYEMFDSRSIDRDPYKFREVYTQKESYQDSRLDREDRDVATSKAPKNQSESEERLVYNRENTDGKMQVFTLVEKCKEYEVPLVTNTVSLSDLRNLEKDSRIELQGENVENNFFERLSAFYNIPAV